MPGLQLPESDLIVSLPGPGEHWDPHTIHTHYFGFSVPERQLGAFVYIRYMPAFPLCQAGVVLYRGLEGRTLSDSLFSDYQLTLPWPEVDGSRITTANGLTVEIVDPGERQHLTFTGLDGRTSFDLDVTAVTPLAARGHVMPGEELHAAEASGGSEQFMHYTGTLTVAGETLAVDSYAARDRSWRQVRTEARDSPPGPPISWTPVFFDAGLAFNQVGFEHPGSNPPWAGEIELPVGAPTFHYAWVSRNGELRSIVDVRRTVTRAHPELHAPLDMEIEATDEAGDTYHLTGEAIGFSPLPAWPNITAYETLMRWTTDDGRVGYGPAQSLWNQDMQHVLNRARG